MPTTRPSHPHPLSAQPGHTNTNQPENVLAQSRAGCSHEGPGGLCHKCHKHHSSSSWQQYASPSLLVPKQGGVVVMKGQGGCVTGVTSVTAAEAVGSTPPPPFLSPIRDGCGHEGPGGAVSLVSQVSPQQQLWAARLPLPSCPQAEGAGAVVMKGQHSWRILIIF